MSTFKSASRPPADRIVREPGLATIYDQDTGNLGGQQRGFNSSVKAGQTLGNYQEVRVRHLRRTIDRYLALLDPDDPAQVLGA